MTKLLAILQLLVGALLGVAAIATLINLAFIITRPETISVVNTMIGQGLLIICLAALARILVRRGLKRLRDPDFGTEGQDAASTQGEEQNRGEA